MTDNAPTNLLFQKISIIGLGMIGGSIAAAVKRHGIASTVCAWDENRASLVLGQDLGLIDIIAEDLKEAVAEADLIILAVPVFAMKKVFEAIELKGQVMTDVGSVKSFVVDAAQSVFGEWPRNFVPGHPIAGSEKNGVLAADPNLFLRHKIILTPNDVSNPDAVSQVEAFWIRLGADVVQMSVSHHDVILAQTSHLPHLLAYALVDTLAVEGNSLEVFEYAAGGFRDFSRIAASDPTMWSDVFASNKESLVPVLDHYLSKLEHLKQLIESGDVLEVKELLVRAKTARDHFSNIQTTMETKFE